MAAPLSRAASQSAQGGVSWGAKKLRRKFDVFRCFDTIEWGHRVGVGGATLDTLV
jgi:hypothetical protein